MTSAYLYPEAKTPQWEMGKDRRRSARSPCVAISWIWSPTADDCDAERREVSAVNLSRHGLAFRTSKPVPTGSFQMVQIALGEQTLTSEVRIIACRQTEAGDYEIGAAFC